MTTGVWTRTTVYQTLACDLLSTGDEVRKKATSGSIVRYAESLLPETHTRSALGRLLPPEARPLARSFLSFVRVGLSKPRSLRRAKSLLACSPRRLHLGSANIYKAGWINIDHHGPGADLIWDLRRPLPFPAGSMQAIFHEHVLEHLVLADAVSLTRECFRVLEPGGVLRIGVPDFGRYARDYSGSGSFIDLVRPIPPTPLLALAEVACGYGHQSLWDDVTLMAALDEIGFEAEVKPFGESVISDVPDSEHRKAETLYVEAVKGPRAL